MGVLAGRDRHELHRDLRAGAFDRWFHSGFVQDWSDINDADIYTPYKATGNIVLKDADLTAALYAPDHNLVVDVKDVAKRDKTNSGKSRARLQSGIDVFGSFIARTIHVKGPANFHYDEKLANVGPMQDYAFISWFEDVNLDRR